MKQFAKQTILAGFIICSILVAVTSLGDAPRAASNPTGNPARKRAQSGAPTFNKEVAPIFQKHCQSCHHPGDIAPFSLMTYKEARPWAQAIREQVILRKMPPWKPQPGCGDFKDARGLSNEEIQTLTAWVDGGAPEGNASDLPAPLEFPDGWPLGDPDTVVAMETDYAPPVNQGDIYRCFSVSTSLRGDRFLSGIDTRPGNRRIVHHVVAYADRTGKSAQLDASDPGPGYTCFGGAGFDEAEFVAGWTPGSRGFFAADGTGIRLPKDARVVIQVHYHPSEEGQSDRTELGLYFAKRPVTRRVDFQAVVNTSFAIPPGAKRHEVTGQFNVPASQDWRLAGVLPHMHLLGREIKLEMTRPGEQPQCLINIPDWDFNWQGNYLFKDPVALPAGTRLRLSCIFDNSTDNPRNPNNPPQTVRWGEATTDEMAVALISYTRDAEVLSLSSPQLVEASVDQNGNLVVTGVGFLPGADIEINGRSLRDTRADAGTQTTRLLSSNLWKVFAPPGEQVNVTVINPDGVRTAASVFTRTGTARNLAAVSAASFGSSLAPAAIVAAFGENLATALAVANALPLPTTLNGTSVRVNGALAPLFFVSPQQVNFLMPAATIPGNAVIEITSGDGTLARATLPITSVAPSLFTANASGSGAPAAIATKDGVNFYPASNADGTPIPLDAGDYLILFGTGFRRPAKETVKITIGGKEAPVLFAGAQGTLAGLDQLNTQLPNGISGVVDVIVTINGRTANTVKARIK